MGLMDSLRFPTSMEAISVAHGYGRITRVLVHLEPLSFPFMGTVEGLLDLHWLDRVTLTFHHLWPIGECHIHCSIHCYTGRNPCGTKGVSKGQVSKTHNQAKLKPKKLHESQRETHKLTQQRVQKEKIRLLPFGVCYGNWDLASRAPSARNVSL